MISVLIPVYNCTIVMLVNTLHQQLSAAKLPFEIIAWDDCSDSQFTAENSQIETLAFTSFKKSTVNRGRIQTRQLLSEKANYDWLLFLDADVIPKNSDFIESYIEVIPENQDAIYGGFAYEEKTPPRDYILRWTYGTAKEQVDATIRKQKPYKIVISGNFLIKKEVFVALNSQIKGQNYGYDNYFGALLKEQSYIVKHINNEVYHLGLDTNADYLKKTEHAVDTLLTLFKNKQITKSENDLLKTFKLLKSFKLNYIIAFLFKRLKPQLTTNLLSSSPSVTRLQFYKLGYMCSKDLQK